jgi:hypothetical protein
MATIKVCILDSSHSESGPVAASPLSLSSFSSHCVLRPAEPHGLKSPPGVFCWTGGVQEGTIRA